MDSPPRVMLSCRATTWLRHWQKQLFWPTKSTTSTSTRAGEWHQGPASSCTPSKWTQPTSAKAPEHICCSSVSTQLLESPTCSPGLFSPFALHSIKFTAGQGKEGIIDFISGSELLIAKAKNGHLTVVSVGWGSLTLDPNQHSGMGHMPWDVPATPAFPLVGAGHRAPPHTQQGTVLTFYFHPQDSFYSITKQIFNTFKTSNKILSPSQLVCGDPGSQISPTADSCTVRPQLIQK